MGDIVQDYSCSFQRQAGRLYVSNSGLFYYSNLFGFEKKIRVDYDRVVEITKTRTTSILVKARGGGEYIFRSFESRDTVVDVIQTYHSNPVRLNASTQLLEEEKSLDDTDDTNASIDDIDSSPSAEVSTEQTKEVAQSNVNYAEVSASDDDAISRWESLKEQAVGWESTITDLEIKSCKSAQQFFDLFLADDATNSLYVFLNGMGDTNIRLGSWKEVDTENGRWIARAINYEHKSAVNTVMVTRHQSYQRFAMNACLRNTTHVKGIRGLPADTFHVEDCWFMESKDFGVVLSVKFRINFTKSTMMRSIITNRGRAEAKEWYNEYVSFVRNKMHLPVQEEVGVVQSKTNIDWLEMAMQLVSSAREHFPELRASAPMMFLVMLAITIYRLKMRVRVLEVALGTLERRLWELENAQLEHVVLPEELAQNLL